jgi:hypothetical protein
MTTNNVYWCDTCGVPLLRKQCENCGSMGRRTVADLKPMFEEERRFFATEADWPELVHLELPSLELPLSQKRQVIDMYPVRRLCELLAGVSSSYCTINPE